MNVIKDCFLTFNPSKKSEWTSFDDLGTSELFL